MVRPGQLRKLRKMQTDSVEHHSFSEDVLRHLTGGPVMIVDLGAVQRNFRMLSAMASGTCAAVVKGDAYGHGMLECAKALRAVGAGLFFTARFEDALLLRGKLGVGPRIAVLDGVTRSSISEAIAKDITPVANSMEQLDLLASNSLQRGEPITAFVQLDTAMNRLGLSPAEDESALTLLQSLDVRAYMTHFASADDVDLDLCRRQVERLKARVRRMPGAPLSIANSCGTFLGPEFHGEMIRPGKSTFGINPLSADSNPLEEPATVLAPVIQVRTLEKGDPVGYSCTWRAPERRRVAILAIGYANGYFRRNSNLGRVAFAGRPAPVVGRVSMDLTAVDVTALGESEVRVGALAEIVGPTISYRSLAETTGTNEHEALISLGRGCRRTYTGGLGIA
jgi:alanine racemase